MTINERVRELRKNYLNKMTLEEFGRRVGVGKTAISKVENGENNVSEQLFTSICREFGVDPDWLRDGGGEPFREVTRSELIESFIGDILKNEPEGRKTHLIGALAALDEAGWDALQKLAEQFLEEQNKKEDKAGQESRPLGTPEGIAEAEAAYEKHFGIPSLPDTSMLDTGSGARNA